MIARALAAVVISAAPADGRALLVESTAYAPCSSGGLMANGRSPRVGAVAMNLLPLGTRIRVNRSPFGPRAFVVSDRIGYGSQLDFWTPSCAHARAWGRRLVRVTW